MKILKDPKQNFPNLAIIQVGENEVSNKCVRNRVKDCEEVDIAADVYHYPENTTESELNDELTYLQEYYDEIVVQLPLPQHIRPLTAPAAIKLVGDYYNLENVVIAAETKEERENATK